MVVLVIAGAAPTVAQSLSSFPSPEPSPEPSSAAPVRTETFFPIAAGTSATPTGLDWQAVGPEPRRRSSMQLLATWDGGFAVVDEDAGRPVVRTSADGLSWATARLPRFQGWDRELIAFEGGLALLTSTYSERPGAAMRFDVWRSPDGLAWERAGGLVVTPPPGCLAGVGDLAVVGGRLQVMGTLCTPPCCGLGPGPGPLVAGMGDLALAGSVPPQRVVAWTSRDGRRWQRQPVRLLDPDGQSARLRSFIGVDPSPDGLLAIPEYGPAAIVESTDGLTWTEFAPFPDGFTPWGDNEPGTAVASGMLLVGQDGTGAGIWRLEPDGSWTRAVSSVEETATHGLATDGRVVIASGVVREWSPGTFAWTLVSMDGGITFDPELAWRGTVDSCVRGVAIHAGVAVMIGCTDGAATLWRAELP